MEKGRWQQRDKGNSRSPAGMTTRKTKTAAKAKAKAKATTATATAKAKAKAKMPGFQRCS
jgi:hypothetical protein